MNHDTQDTEKRLLLAFGLMILVIAGWPVLARKIGLTPARAPEMALVHEEAYVEPWRAGVPVDRGIITPPQAQRIEVSREIQTTSSKVWVAGSTAGIATVEIRTQTYRMDGGEKNLLLAEDGPGLGAVAWDGGSSVAVEPWTRWEMERGAEAGPRLSYRTELEPGLVAAMQYDFGAGGQNAFTITVSVNNQGSASRNVSPRMLAGQLLHDPFDHGRYRLLRASVAGKTRTIAARRGAAGQRLSGPVGWVTAQTKYYATILEPKTPSSGLVVARGPSGDPSVWVEWPAVSVAPGGTQHWVARGYIGPLDYRFLDALQLDEAVSLGAFTTVSRLLQAGMHMLGRTFQSYGAAIVALTALLSLLFSPLTLVSFRTMKKMELLQPELKALQERYKKDPKRLNEEVMKTYRKHGANPLAGCLPLLVQMPIFIGLYQVLSRSPELRGAKFLLIKDLSAPDQIIPLPAALPILGSAINILPLAMAAMMFIQQRLSARSAALTEEQKIQQQVFGIMPLLFGAMFYALPSALVLYWLLNTTLTVVQQQFVLKRFV